MKKTILSRAAFNSLREKIAQSEEKKRELKDYIRELHERYSRQEISYSFYVETSYKKFDGKDVQEWIEYFEDYIKDCKKRIRKEVKVLAVKHVSILIFSIVALVSIIRYILAKI